MKQYRSLAIFSLVALLFVSYNFMSAQWSAPTATAPNDNTPAPINVGTTTQAKNGNLAANILAATTEMRSNRYCDALGNNCTAANGNGLVYKICSVLVSGNWRDTIVVPGSWTSTTCQSFMTAVGATSYAFGCIAGDKFYENDDTACDGAVAEPMPSRKFCSVVAASGNWRDTILVPASFGDAQCASFQTTTGAVGRQMGCLTDTGVTFGSTSACNSGGSTAAQDLKFCSVALSGNWRDSFNVPASWDFSACASYGTATGATGAGSGFSLGCVLPTGVTFGSTRSCS
ncbi:MAG: hypothetical protein ACK4SL_03710 [Candidatus Paceibacteria bacterium]